MDSQTQQLIIDLYSKHGNVGTVAKCCKIKAATVYYNLRRLGVATPRPKYAEHTSLLVPSIQEKLASEQYTIRGLAVEIGLSVNALKKVIKTEHIYVPRPTREMIYGYRINESSFDVITPQSAYWIGFLLGDGCISVRNRHTVSKGVSLTLQRRDERHLYKFRDFLQSTHAVSQVISKTRGKEYLTSRFAFCSNKIVDTLGQYNIYPRKSMNECGADALLDNSDFWRGLIDADGTVAIVNMHGYETALLRLNSSLEACQQFQSYVRRLVPMYKQKITAHGSIFRATVQGKQAKVVVQALYQGSVVYLDRKMETAEKILKRGVNKWVTSTHRVH